MHLADLVCLLNPDLNGGWFLDCDMIFITFGLYRATRKGPELLGFRSYECLSHRLHGHVAPRMVFVYGGFFFPFYCGKAPLNHDIGRIFFLELFPSIKQANQSQSSLHHQLPPGRSCVVACGHGNNDTGEGNVWALGGCGFSPWPTLFVGHFFVERKTCSNQPLISLGGKLIYVHV